MLVAVFLAHGDDPFGKMEKGLLFATFSLMLWVPARGALVSTSLVIGCPRLEADWAAALYAVEMVHPSQVAFAPSGTIITFAASEHWQSVHRRGLRLGKAHRYRPDADGC